LRCYDRPSGQHSSRTGTSPVRDQPLLEENSLLVGRIIEPAELAVTEFRIKFRRLERKRVQPSGVAAALARTGLGEAQQFLADAAAAQIGTHPEIVDKQPVAVGAAGQPRGDVAVRLPGATGIRPASAKPCRRGSRGCPKRFAHRLEDANSPVRPLPSAHRRRQKASVGHCRNCPRDGGVSVGHRATRRARRMIASPANDPDKTQVALVLLSSVFESSTPVKADPAGRC